MPPEPSSNQDPPTGKPDRWIVTLHYFDQWRETLGLPGITAFLWLVGFYFLASPRQKERMVEQIWFAGFMHDGLEPRFLVPFLFAVFLTLFTVISYYRRLVKAKEARIQELEERIKKLEPYAPWVSNQPRLIGEE